MSAPRHRRGGPPPAADAAPPAVADDAGTRGVVALLDDTAPAQRVLEISSALAQRLRRPLELVYVESASALLAAALPITQVLAPGGAQWLPFSPPDVERGYRAQQARLRELAERIVVRHDVHWSIHVVRGALAQVAAEWHARSDLVFVAAAALVTDPARAPARRRPLVAVLADETPAGRQAVQVAQQVAQALGAALEQRRSAAATACDLLVLPRHLATPALWAARTQPVLLVA